MLRPYHIIRYHDNSMHMIRHDHELIQCNIRKMAGNFQPVISGNFSDVVQVHYTINYFTE